MTEEKIAADKNRLREQMKRRRDGIAEHERAACSRLIATLLLSEEWYAESTDILVYSAIRSEVDLSGFCEQAWRDGKALYFPRVELATMEFYRVDSPAQLVRGSFSVMEPRMKPPQAEEAAAEEDCLYAKSAWAGTKRSAPVLVPGVAFSRSGGRLGYGGGYYDRYLASHPQLMPIGVCFAAQLVGEAEKSVALPLAWEGAALTMEAHDRRMDRIVTECGVWEHGSVKRKEPESYRLDKQREGAWI